MKTLEKLIYGNGLSLDINQFRKNPSKSLGDNIIKFGKLAAWRIGASVVHNDVSRPSSQLANPRIRP